MHSLWPARWFSVLFELTQLPEIETEAPTLADMPLLQDDRKAERKQYKMQRALYTFVTQNMPESLYRDVPHFQDFLDQHDSTLLSQELFVYLLRSTLLWAWIRGIPISSLRSIVTR